MTRRTFREHCVRLLFNISFYSAEERLEQIERYIDIGEELEESFDDRFSVADMESSDKKELKDRLIDILSKLKEIDEKLAKLSIGWNLNRIGRVELSILRLAAYEILFDEHIPDKVSINEAVELAKKYAPDDAASFINAVLGKLI